MSHTEQMREARKPKHKVIRDASLVDGDYTMVEVPGLRSLVADLDIARALLIRAASSLDDTGNTDNALLLKQIDRFLMDKWNDSEAA